MMKLPTKILKEMTADDAAVYLYLQYAVAKSTRVSIPRIATAIHISSHRVRRAIRRLIDADYLRYRFDGRWVEYEVRMPNGTRWLLRRIGRYGRLSMRTESHVRVPQEVVQALLEGRLNPDALRLLLLLRWQSSASHWTWRQLQLYLMWSRARVGRGLSRLAAGGWIVREHGVRYLSDSIPTPRPVSDSRPLSRHLSCLVPDSRPVSRPVSCQETLPPVPIPAAPARVESAPNRSMQIMYLVRRGVPAELAFSIVERGAWHEVMQRFERGDPVTEVLDSISSP